MATFPTSLPNRTGTPLGLSTVINHVGGLVRTQRAAGGTSLDVDFDPVTANYATAGYLTVGPSAGPWNVIKYTGRTGGSGVGTFTGCTGGQDGTTDVQSNVGYMVAQAPIAANVNHLADELIAGLTKLGTGSSTPSSANTILTATGSGATAWNRPTHDALTVPVASVYATSSQSLQSGILTPLLLEGEDTDPQGWHSPTTNPERIVIGTAGTYIVVGIGYLQFPTPAAGFLWGGYITTNYYEASASHIGIDSNVPAANSSVLSCIPISPPVALAVNDYLTLSIYQASGSTLSTFYATSVRCRLGVMRIA